MLSAEVAETSGLVCRERSTFLTLNDSGHPPVVFQLNAQGQLQHQFRLPVTNQDWEAMSSDGTWLYIADTGNNSGTRASGLIHRFRLDNANRPTALTSIQYRFANYHRHSVQPYQHPFDIEAIAATTTMVYAFNKSWTAEPTLVFAIDPQQAEQTLTPIATLTDLPGVVTDAAWSEQHQVFLLTGYANPRTNVLGLMLTGNWSPFVAIVARDFQIKKVLSIADAQQVEGICIDPDDGVWLSQEQYRESKAKIWRVFGLAEVL